MEKQFSEKLCWLGAKNFLFFSEHQNKKMFFPRLCQLEREMEKQQTGEHKTLTLFVSNSKISSNAKQQKKRENFNIVFLQFLSVVCWMFAVQYLCLLKFKKMLLKIRMISKCSTLALHLNFLTFWIRNPFYNGVKVKIQLKTSGSHYQTHLCFLSHTIKNKYCFQRKIKLYLLHNMNS